GAGAQSCPEAVPCRRGQPDLSRAGPDAVSRPGSGVCGRPHRRHHAGCAQRGQRGGGGVVPAGPHRLHGHSPLGGGGHGRPRAPGSGIDGHPGGGRVGPPRRPNGRRDADPLIVPAAVWPQRGEAALNPLVLWNWFVDWVLPFAVVFGTIVLVHELGHFLVARRAGVKVHEFAIGFGRAFVQWKRGETRYSIRIFPLGGFVKLAGMDPAVEREEEIAPDDERSFQRKPLWQRMAIIAAGPAANFLLAFLLLVVFYAAITVPFAVADVLPGSPAERAGILPGDRIVAVERQRVTNLAELSG